jgi:hypothetical protein
MKYSKSERAYFRNSKKKNSIKGGLVKVNRILEESDFSGKNGNNVVPRQIFKTVIEKYKSNKFQELTVLITPTEKKYNIIHKYTCIKTPILSVKRFLSSCSIETPIFLKLKFKMT